jgi:hypothetical protein
MGVINGAHGYVSRESQMARGNEWVPWENEDLIKMINEARCRAEANLKNVPVYTKPQFIQDYKDICFALGYLLWQSVGIKKLIFELIDIKLNSGADVMQKELQAIRRQKRGHI